MANDDQIEIDSNKVDADLLASERSSQAVPVGASSILNLRTIAAGVTGAAIAALVLGAVVLFGAVTKTLPYRCCKQNIAKRFVLLPPASTRTRI